MKEEFGKWLMDIAKYITTAMLLTTAFGDMNSVFTILAGILSAAATLVMGLFLVRKKKEEV